MIPMNRTNFLIDGFNLYHSVKQASYDMRGSQTKWLDIKAFCESHLHVIGQKTGNRASLGKIYYFSALATHMQRGRSGPVSRHQLYLRCLQDVEIEVKLGKFKEKRVKCQHCGKTNIRHEEKETDVAIGVKLLECAISNQCETVVIVSGDTDIAPAIRSAKILAPHKDTIVAFPYKRTNNSLATEFMTFNIGQKSYAKHQFPNAVMLKSGKTIQKPANW